jgi:arsenate reductase-like glutaredoxin family protein
MSNASQKEKLFGALKRKMELLSKVLGITKAQKNYIADDDMEKLLSELDLRQKLIDEILMLDNSIDRAYLKSLIEQGDTQARELNDSVKRTLQEISAEDKKNISSAENKVTEYKEQIRIIKSEKNRMNSYSNSNANSDGIFIDKKK